MALDSPQLVEWLKAAGEPSRLRLLTLCAQRDWSVSDLADTLGQSEPRVSRHLKILCEAGLLERLRQGQWVHYQLTQRSAAAGFVRGILAQLDRAEAVMPGGVSSESRLGRALRGFVEAGKSSERLGSVLVVGAEHPELLESAAMMARHCTVITHSRRGVQSARAFAERKGVPCRVLLATHSEGLSEQDVLRAGELGSFDAVVLDRLAMPEAGFPGSLANGRRALAPSGRLWLFERYESLEGIRGKVIEHPLGRLRRLLGDAQLSCQRLSPIEADGQHVLAAAAVPAPAAARGAGSVSAA